MELKDFIAEVRRHPCLTLGRANPTRRTVQLVAESLGGTSTVQLGFSTIEGSTWDQLREFIFSKLALKDMILYKGLGLLDDPEEEDNGDDVPETPEVSGSPPTENDMP